MPGPEALSGILFPRRIYGVVVSTALPWPGRKHGFRGLTASTSSRPRSGFCWRWERSGHLATRLLPWYLHRPRSILQAARSSIAASCLGTRRHRLAVFFRAIGGALPCGTASSRSVEACMQVNGLGLFKLILDDALLAVNG